MGGRKWWRKKLPGLLQQVCSHISTNDGVILTEANLNVLAESTAVIIASGFGISDGLKCDAAKGNEVGISTGESNQIRADLHDRV